MADAVAVLNAGSSSIKYSLFALRGAELDLVLRGQVEGLQTSPRFIARDAAGRQVEAKAWGDGVQLGHAGALDHLIPFVREHLGDDNLAAIGHRVVHGGMHYARPVRMDRRTLDALRAFVPLAPLHQPHNLAAIELLMGRLPDMPQVACFDTGFHRGNSEIAQMFALPADYHAQGVRRYGFHGLSYEYIATVLPQVDARVARGRAVVLHLGNGASMCALVDGRSVASTMGFTAVDGLPMGTRCGALDPGVILYLMDQRGMDARAIEKLVYSQSGLLGVSGISSDMRALLDSDDIRARTAIDLYLYRIRRELGSLAAAMGGLDALVFTAGIGEHAPLIRRRVCEDAAWLGVALDATANTRGGPRISKESSRVAVYVVPTNEELMIARHTRTLLAERGAEPAADASRHSARATLRDGSTITIRAQRPTDREGMRDVLVDMSPESIRRRFFAPRRSFSEDEVARFLEVDFVRQVALVAVADEAIVGAGRYIVTEPGVAEVAFGVADRWQSRGMAGLLMEHLVAIARRQGVHRLVAEVLRENVPMLAVFRASGLQPETRNDGGVVHVTMDLH
jgi:acetate kinase